MPRVTRLVLAALLHATLAHAVVAERGDLVSYSFDDGRVETGPDTFVVFEHANGRVDLSADFYVTPYESVVIEDVPGNEAFPELQGYFPEVTTGKLYAQFYLMPTQRDEELNLALAGPARFNVEPQGIALWIVVRDGKMFHVSDWIPKVLLPRFDPFQWYRFDIVYDVDRGTYDLQVGIADRPPLVTLRHQPNAAGSPGSGVSVFSFIGDLRDRSSVRYYLDSLNIGRNDLFARTGAPGAGAGPLPVPRRSLVDREVVFLRTELKDLDGFLPVRGASESREVNDPYVAGLRAYLAKDPDRALQLFGRALEKARTATERALVLNAHGVVLLRAGNHEAATRDFAAAADALPGLAEPSLNLVLAAARQGDWTRALRLAGDAAGRLHGDNRLPLLKANIWMARDRVAEAAAELDSPDAAEDPYLVGYRMLLDVVAHGRGAVRAADVVALVAAHPDDLELREVAGDVLFMQGDHRGARAQYVALADAAPDGGRTALVKAAECSERLGDLAGARAFRERVYGRL